MLLPRIIASSIGLMIVIEIIPHPEDDALSNFQLKAPLIICCVHIFEKVVTFKELNELRWPDARIVCQ